MLPWLRGLLPLFVLAPWPFQAGGLEIDNGLLPSGSSATVSRDPQRFPVNSFGETECRATAAPADLVFLVDGSSSVGEQDFQKVKSFMAGVVSGFEVGSGAQFAVVQFSDLPRTEFSLMDHASSTGLKRAIMALPYQEDSSYDTFGDQSGATRTGAALEYLLGKEFVSAKGARDNVRQVIVTITDGASQDDVKGPAMRAKSLGVDLFAVAISPQVNEEQLLELAGGDGGRVFRVPDFQDLQTTFRNKLVTQVCRALVIPGNSPVQRDEEADYTGGDGGPNPSITCAAESITLTALTRNAFAGKVYVKGFFDKDACRYIAPTGSVDTQVSFSVPMEGCGVRRGRQLSPPGMYYEATVIVSFHKTFLTKVDRAFNVRCFFMEASKTVSQTLDVSMLPTESLNDNAAMPLCTYSVRRGSPDGETVKYAKVGEPIFHVWECPQDGSAMYAILVNTCTIDDGRGKKVEMVDERGCSLDPIVLQNIVYEPEKSRAYQETHAFKFADVMSVFFTCRISLCMASEADCQALTPPSCDGAAPARPMTEPPPTQPDYGGVDYGGGGETSGVPDYGGTDYSEPATTASIPDYYGGGETTGGETTAGEGVDYGEYGGAMTPAMAGSQTIPSSAYVTDPTDYGPATVDYANGTPPPPDNVEGEYGGDYGGYGDTDAPTQPAETTFPPLTQPLTQAPPPKPTEGEYGGDYGGYGGGVETMGPQPPPTQPAAPPDPTGGDYGGGDYGSYGEVDPGTQPATPAPSTNPSDYGGGGDYGSYGGGDYGAGSGSAGTQPVVPQTPIQPQTPAVTESYGNEAPPPPPPSSPEYKEVAVEGSGPEGAVVGTLDAFTQVDILDEDPAPAGFFQPTPMEDLLDGDFDAPNTRQAPPATQFPPDNSVGGGDGMGSPQPLFPDADPFAEETEDASFDYLSNEVSAEGAGAISDEEAALFGNENYDYGAVRRRGFSARQNRTRQAFRAKSLQNPFTVSGDQYAMDGARRKAARKAGTHRRRRPKGAKRRREHKTLARLTKRKDFYKKRGYRKATKGRGFIQDMEVYLPKALRPSALAAVLGSVPRTSEYDVCLGHAAMAGISALGFSSILFAGVAGAWLYNARRPDQKLRTRPHRHRSHYRR